MTESKTIVDMGIIRREVLSKAATGVLLLAGIAASGEAQAPTPGVPPGRLPAVPPAPSTAQTKTPLPPSLCHPSARN